MQHIFFANKLKSVCLAFEYFIELVSNENLSEDSGLLQAAERKLSSNDEYMLIFYKLAAIYVF